MCEINQCQDNMNKLSALISTSIYLTTQRGEDGGHHETHQIHQQISTTEPQTEANKCQNPSQNGNQNAICSMQWR